MPFPLESSFFPSGHVIARTGYLHTINYRVQLGFLKWGFVIYRGTYGDNERWEKGLALIKDSARRLLRENNQFDQLGHDLEWTIIEDRRALEGAPKEVVRQRFREWSASRSVKRDGVGADNPLVTKQIPRFRCCVYIDQACLNSFTARYMSHPSAPQKNYWWLSGQVALIDGTHGHHDEQYAELMAASRARDDAENAELEDEGDDMEEEHEPIEGNTSQDVGWKYTEASLLVSAYERLHPAGTLDWETWYYFYANERPRRLVVRKELQFEPLAEFDISRLE